MIEGLPPEVLYTIFQYLDVYELCTCSKVCKTWRSAANSNRLWKIQCALRWKDKINHPLRLHPSIDCTPFGAQMTIKEIKQILKLRRQKMAHLLEKSEFLDLLLKTTPRKVPLIEGKWKASYIVAEIDSKRTQITKDELTTKKWSFKFKQWDARHPMCIAKFNQDYTYETTLFEQILHWRFYAGAVQVDQYPPLELFRTPDWGWGLQNEYVINYELPNEE